MLSGTFPLRSAFSDEVYTQLAAPVLDALEGDVSCFFAVVGEGDQFNAYHSFPYESELFSSGFSHSNSEDMSRSRRLLSQIITEQRKSFARSTTQLVFKWLFHDKATHAVIGHCKFKYNPKDDGIMLHNIDTRFFHGKPAGYGSLEHRSGSGTALLYLLSLFLSHNGLVQRGQHDDSLRRSSGANFRIEADFVSDAKPFYKKFDYIQASAETNYWDVLEVSKVQSYARDYFISKGLLAALPEASTFERQPARLLDSAEAVEQSPALEVCASSAADQQVQQHEGSDASYFGLASTSLFFSKVAKVSTQLADSLTFGANPQ